MVDLAQRPAGTERTQQNSLNSLEFSEFGPGYDFTSHGCSCPPDRCVTVCPLPDLLPAIRAMQQVPWRSTDLHGQQQLCTAAELPACGDAGLSLKPLSQRQVTAVTHL